MLKKGKIELKASTADIEDKKFVISVKIFNPDKRTLYAYGSPRRILYDNTTGKLKVCLHDQHIEEDSIISRHLRQPKFVPLAGKTETEVKISLPKVVKRIRSAAERGGSGALTEHLRVSEAKEIELEIAHQDTPFYYKPKIDNAKQLKEWGSAISKAKFERKPPDKRLSRLPDDERPPPNIKVK